jgi:curved DNA-binding protein CbpA
VLFRSGVSRSATDEELKQAFEQRQRRYHPDTLIGIDRGLVHEKVEELYVRIHNAYRTLIDPKTRERYLAQLENRTETTHTNVASRTGRYVTLKSKPEHALLFEEGFSHLRSGDFVKARALFKEAIEHEPSARYRAYEAWTDYLVNPGEHQASAEKTLASLHAENPDEALFPYLLGNIALREKNVDRATAFFQKAVDIDPQHIESARQLRILRMRQKSSEVSGLFDLFKKDNR